MEKKNNPEVIEAEGTVEETKEAKKAAPKKRLNPIVKYALLGVGAVVVIGGVVYLVTKSGAKVPAEAIDKGAELAADVATAVI